MNRIYKYSLGTMSGRITVAMHPVVNILSVGEQSGELIIWAEVEAGKPTETQYFAIAWTGWEPPDNSIYIGTVQMNGLVYHIYDLGV